MNRKDVHILLISKNQVYNKNPQNFLVTARIFFLLYSDITGFQQFLRDFAQIIWNLCTSIIENTESYQKITAIMTLLLHYDYKRVDLYCTHSQTLKHNDALLSQNIEWMGAHAKSPQLSPQGIRSSIKGFPGNFLNLRKLKQF